MASTDEGYDLVVTGVALLPDGERAAAVAVRGEHIAGVLPADVPLRAQRHITAADGWIAPGFIDLQLNGALGCDFTTQPERLPLVAGWLPRTGVTAFLPTLISAPLPHLEHALRVLAATIRPRAGAAMPLGVHLEGPYLNPAYAGAHAVTWLRPCCGDELAALCAAGPVRLVTLAPELEGAVSAIAWLRQRGIVVSVGHSGASYEQALAAIEAGASLGTHLFNAMAPLHHRAPGLVGALLQGAGARASIIADGIHVHPAVLALAYRARGTAGLALVSDAMAALGVEAGEHQLAGQAVQVHHGAARLPDGTLAGSVITLDAAVRTMIAASGCTLAEAVQMASTTPAAVLGLTDRGRIAPGTRADLVVLDADYRVRCTIIAGRLVWADE